MRHSFNFSQLGRLQNCSVLRATEDKAEEAPFVKDSLDVENGDICAPDTLDFVQGIAYLLLFVLHGSRGAETLSLSPSKRCTNYCR